MDAIERVTKVLRGEVPDRVPVGLHGADRLLPLHSPIIRPAKLGVQIGPPVDLSDLCAGRVTRAALAAATDRMADALRQVLPPERR